MQQYDEPDTGVCLGIVMAIEVSAATEVAAGWRLFESVVSGERIVNGDWR